MDLRRFLDLYVSESQEHVRLLHRSLLALEGGQDSQSMDEAFRAAHTLKGLSAAMGYSTVADLAHHLEDRLEEIRAGRIPATPDVVDMLLKQADALEEAITASVDMPPGQSESGAGSGNTATSADAAASGAAPVGTVSVAVVRLRPDAPIKSARAMLVMRALDDGAGVLGSEPTSFDDDFDGVFRVFFSADADIDAAESAIVAAGEVASVEFEAPARAAPRTGASDVAMPAAAVPTRQVRVDAGRLDELAEGIAELSVLHGRVGPDTNVPVRLQAMIERMGTVLTNLQHEVLALRMVPVRHAFERLPRVVRDAARAVGKDVELTVSGDDVELDRTIIEEIGDPLVHLLRNAVDHGIETADARRAAGKSPRGRIHVSAERERSSVRIVVEDDGGGVAADRVVRNAKAAGLLPADAPDNISDEELFRLLSHAGLSTSAQVTAVSGRGVGMDVVVSRIRSLGGAIEMQTQAGVGTTFSIRLPITLALALALRVRIGDEDYAIPLTHVSEAVELNGNAATAGDREMLRLRDEEMPLIRMRRMLDVRTAGHEGAAVIAEMGGRRAALAVDTLIGREQILVKSFDPVTGMFPFFSGATMLADGRPALVIDPLSVI